MDRLHHKASPYPLTETDRRTLELHGTLHYVHCPKNHHVLERDEWQKLLASLNPRWQEIVEETRGRPVKMNPDGDVSTITARSILSGIEFEILESKAMSSSIGRSRGGTIRPICGSFMRRMREKWDQGLNSQAECGILRGDHHRRSEGPIVSFKHAL